jgi:acyl carrier protein
MKNKIYTIICDSIEEINEVRPENSKIDKEYETILFGGGSSLDSLGLVNLIVAIEQNIEDKLDINITIADEKAMSQTSSPFKTIESLVEYILKLI